MSSKVKALGRSMGRREYNYMYSLAGSCAHTIGAVNGLTEADIRGMYSKARKAKLRTPMDMADYMWGLCGKEENKPLRANMVLVYDINNVRSPQITLELDGHIVSPYQDGSMEGIMQLAYEGRSYIGVEYLYDEEGEEIND